MVQLFTFELVWPPGMHAPDASAPIHLSSTRGDLAVREAQALWRGLAETPKTTPSGFQIRDAGNGDLVHQYRSYDA